MGIKTDPYLFVRLYDCQQITDNGVLDIISGIWDDPGLTISSQYRADLFPSHRRKWIEFDVDVFYVPFNETDAS